MKFVKKEKHFDIFMILSMLTFLVMIAWSLIE